MGIKMFHHIISGLSSIKSFKDYRHQFEWHMMVYYRQKGIVVVGIDLPGCKYMATVGDYDLDCKYGLGNTISEAVEDLGLED